MTTLLMNGASRGIGLHAARRLLEDHPGLRLIVVARGEQPALPRTTVIRGDLTSLDSVRKIAAQVTEPLDGYIGNAGVQMTTATTTTVDGYETTFAVNVLAHHLLLRLLPLTTRARVVITGSDAHFGDLRHNLGIVPAPTWTTPGELARPNPKLKGRGAYATSKLGVLYLVHALARRGVDAYTWNPAFTPGTGLVRADRIGDVLFRRVFPLFPGVNTPQRAGDQLAAAAAGPAPGPAGSYIDRATVTSSSTESHNQAREEELWAFCEKATS
ncbi:SDR family NAD(P)-dependent oxidoreductase [Paractinoplanes lichenicola]|uniref:SDR family NAD(P)-dependent oxidoreductase n=1 Tax=Paractinoplanes lichenicola TaxID=2802976 RepID=A0ABS1W4I6_9ACTN|nr:SDR family NAD(P)-dependent oxidoreductase [Actinoplanes lichenicola]MBL7261652.1 SDR family NAD(P)-dependent oxidoreductase [Actinoplanes lichenicola]